MEQAREQNRFECDRVGKPAHSHVAEGGSIVDALFALPSAPADEHQADAVDRAVSGRLQVELARKLRDMLDQRLAKSA